LLAVLAAVLGLLVCSIATERRSLPRGEMHTQTRRGDQFHPRRSTNPTPYAHRVRHHGAAADQPGARCPPVGIWRL